MRVGGQRHATAALPPGKSPGTYCRGGRVGPSAGLDGCERRKENLLLPPEFENLAFRPVAWLPCRLCYFIPQSQSTENKTCVSAHIWVSLGSNQGRCGEKLESNRLKYGTVGYSTSSGRNMKTLLLA